MSDQELLQIKNITLDYLKEIGASVEESEGLYTVDIPSNFEAIFGGNQKRITFDSEVASTHSCELVIYGSNFLATILDKIKQQAPVISGHLRKQGDFPIDLLDNIPVYRGTIKLGNSEDMEKTVIRFYFNVNLKSVKSESTLQWVDIDSETLKKVELPKNLNLEPLEDEMDFDKKSIDVYYDNAVKILQKDIAPIIDKYVVQTTEDLNQDLHSLESSFTKRVDEIKQNITNQKYKLQELDNKIWNAKKYSTRNRYKEQKVKLQDKIYLEENESSTQIDKLKHDKLIQQKQISKRYTTKITSTLVASQVFSYSITRCTLDVKNQHARNKTMGEYLEHSQEFVIPCQVCSVNSKEIHLCVNGHVGCDLCSEQCITCEKDMCKNCIHELNLCNICSEKICNNCTSSCQLCSKMTCTKHILSCPHCSDSFCHLCSNTCEFCSKRFCENSLNNCGMCKKRTCENDSQICFDCKQHICSTDRDVCAICDQVHCKNDSSKCKTCSQWYSVGCITNNQCRTCENIIKTDSNDSKILEIIKLDSNLVKYKKWECATNARFSIFRAKKMLGKRFIVYDKFQNEIIINKKGGLL